MTKKIILFFIFTTVVFSQVSIADLNKLSNNELDQLRNKLQSETTTKSTNQDKIELEAINTINLKPEVSKKTEEYFGYNYFKRDITFFDNIPTPYDFKLGPGDEITLSLWGETNLRDKFTINKDGLI